MGVTFAGYDCLDPVALRETLLANDPPIPVDHWWGLANVYRTSLGFRPAVAFVLLEESSINSMVSSGEINRPQKLKFNDSSGGANNSVTVDQLYVREWKRIYPAAEDDDKSAVLVELIDYRHLLGKTPVDKRYNVRSEPAGDYLECTLDGGVAWTWNNILADLWSENIEMGVPPNLPFTPHGTPEGFVYEAEYLLDALTHFLTRLGCTAMFDPTTAKWSILRLGDAADIRKAQQKIAVWTRQGLKIWDGFNSESVVGKFPEKVRVSFWKQPYPSNGVGQVFHVDVAGTVSPVERGSVAILWDDLAALYPTDSGSGSGGDCEAPDPENLDELEARAAERASDYYRIVSAMKPNNRVFAGLSKDAKIALQGADSTTLILEDRGGGYRFELESGKYPPGQDLEKWKPYRLFWPSEPEETVSIVPIILGWAVETVSYVIDAGECSVLPSEVSCASTPECAGSGGSGGSGGGGLEPPLHGRCPYTCECDHSYVSSWDFKIPESGVFEWDSSDDPLSVTLLGGSECNGGFYSFQWNYTNESKGFRWIVEYEIPCTVSGDVEPNCATPGTFASRFSAILEFFDPATGVVTYSTSHTSITGDCSQLVVKFPASPTEGVFYRRAAHTIQTFPVLVGESVTLYLRSDTGYEGVFTETYFNTDAHVSANVTVTVPDATSATVAIDGGTTFSHTFAAATVCEFRQDFEVVGSLRSALNLIETDGCPDLSDHYTLTLNLKQTCGIFDPDGGGGVGSGDGLPECYSTPFCSCKSRLTATSILEDGETVSYAGASEAFLDDVTDDYGWEITFVAYPTLTARVGFLSGGTTWGATLTDGVTTETGELGDCSCETAVYTFPTLGFTITLTLDSCPTVGSPPPANCKQFMRRGVLRARNLNLVTRQWVGGTYCMLPDEYFVGYCDGEQTQVGLCPADTDAPPQEVSFAFDDVTDTRFNREWSLRIAECFEWGRCYESGGGSVAAKLTATQYTTYTVYRLTIGDSDGVCAPDGSRPFFDPVATYEETVYGDPIIKFPVTLSLQGGTAGWPSEVTVDAVE